ncbi:SDR family oxidoreductase [Rhodococcus sp. HM1]|uniref:SDR family NAD(P)-dependent oxidoreductase n=1 Tax=Rhodococcus sp. HM1 TaxID=2937759 RepID=UPI00200B78A1|nr:SDR family oxidoreductase [Rhodococcus sp. HM1]MCK8674795.1 SDR family oxidoreductase [Rhodococcus sp. HM1]
MTAPAPRGEQLCGVITGAASGIGRACVDLFLARGARIDAWDRSADALKSLESLGAGAGAAIATRVVDVTDPESVTSASHAVHEQWGRVDFVVNCAGAFLVGPLSEVPADSVRGLFDVNVLGTTLVTQALLPGLTASRGSIVNVASAVALKATPSNSHYAASKAAVAHLTRCWALELGPQGVRVNCVAPGPTATPIYRAAGMTVEQEDALLRERASTIPLRRIGDPVDTARWITTLALEDNWTTGAVVPIDGGMSL